MTDTQVKRNERDMNPDVMGVLNEFDIKHPEDPAKVCLELVHDRCGAVVCDVEDGDTLSLLAGVADSHHCQEASGVTSASDLPYSLADLRAHLSEQ